MPLCSAKNLDGIQTFLISEIGNGTERFYFRFSKDFERKRPKYARISGIGNETGRFYLGFPKDSDVCDQDDLGFQESEVTGPQGEAGFRESEEEMGMVRLDFWNPHFYGLSRSPSSPNTMTK